MKVAVQDANVFIDMELAGLYDLWFQLGVETHTTDLIRAELEKGRHHVTLGYFAANTVHVHQLSFQQLLEVQSLTHSVTRRASFNDCSVLLLAIQLDAMLLSSDRPLRSAALTDHIEVHGTLWVFDQLVAAKLLRPAIACQKLRLLLSNNRYLPTEEVKKRFTKWQKDDA